MNDEPHVHLLEFDATKCAVFRSLEQFYELQSELTVSMLLIEILGKGFDKINYITFTLLVNG